MIPLKGCVRHDQIHNIATRKILVVVVGSHATIKSFTRENKFDMGMNENFTITL